jgi:glycosyltransferase involved in cell wall biosynthesis
MKRVSILAYKNGTDAGWATVAHFVEKYLIETGYQVDFISAMERKLFSLASKLGPLGWIWDYLDLYPVFKKSDIILVLCEPLLPISVLHKFFRPRTKVILVGYGTYIYFPFVKGSLHKLRRSMLRYVDQLLVSSNYTKKKVEEFYTDNAKLKVWALGVDSTVYKHDEAIKKEPKLLFVGHQKERKGIRHLIEAFSTLTHEFPDLKLTFVGPIDRQFRHHVQSLEMGKKIEFTGPISQEQLVKQFNSAMLHVLPSVNTHDSFEGFGLVHLEANACGTPSIGSKGTANEDVIIDSKTGYLVEQKNAAELAMKIKIALSNPDKYTELCRNSISHADEFSWKKSVDRLIELIEMS